MRKILILALPLILACGMMDVANTPAEAGGTISSMTIAEIPQFSVSVEKLHVRLVPNGDVVGYLYAGDTVQVTEIRAVGDILWCRHAAGWSACRFMEAQGD